MKLVVTWTNVIFLTLNDKCQHLKDLHNSINTYSIQDVTKNHKKVKDPFKGQESTKMIWLTCRKWTSVKRMEANGIEFNLRSWTVLYYSSVLHIVPKWCFSCFLKGFWRHCKSQRGAFLREYKYGYPLLFLTLRPSHLFIQIQFCINYRKISWLHHPTICLTF